MHHVNTAWQNLKTKINFIEIVFHVSFFQTKLFKTLWVIHILYSKNWKSQCAGKNQYPLWRLYNHRSLCTLFLKRHSKFWLSLVVLKVLHNLSLNFSFKVVLVFIISIIHFGTVLIFFSISAHPVFLTAENLQGNATCKWRDVLCFSIKTYIWIWSLASIARLNCS